MPKKKTNAGDEEARAQEAFVRHLLTYTSRLVRLEHGHPISAGSGVLYQTGERLFLLSALHVFKRQGWFLEMDYVVGGNTLSIEVPPVNWLVAGTITDSKISVSEQPDGFAWVEFDLPKLKAKLKAEQEKYKKPITLPVYRGPIAEMAKPDEPYAFAAAPPRDYVPSIVQLIREPVFELHMAYEGDDERGFYRFSLARQHQGDAAYKGSSGSPIADRNGKIVALVQGGSQAENVVYGVPLARYSKYMNL